MAFGGWPAEAVEFYEGLEADNSKSYWTSRKAVYEGAVLRPKYRDDVDAFGFHLLYPAFHLQFFEFEIGNAVAQQPANTIGAFVESY